MPEEDEDDNDEIHTDGVASRAEHSAADAVIGYDTGEADGKTSLAVAQALVDVEMASVAHASEPELVSTAAAITDAEMDAELQACEEAENGMSAKTGNNRMGSVAASTADDVEMSNAEVRPT